MVNIYELENNPRVAFTDLPIFKHFYYNQSINVIESIVVELKHTNIPDLNDYLNCEENKNFYFYFHKTGEELGEHIYSPETFFSYTRYRMAKVCMITYPPYGVNIEKIPYNLGKNKYYNLINI